MGEYHHQDKCCSSCCCSCHQKEADSCSFDGNGDSMNDWWFEIADEAWSEVLKEKIKEHILSTQKSRITELAKIVSEANRARWMGKMEKKNVMADFQEKLCHFFSKSKK